MLYALYLVCNLLYFIKIFPYLISIFISEEQLQVLFHWKKLYGVELELTLSILLIASYTLFIQSFVILISIELTDHPKIGKHSLKKV